MTTTAAKLRTFPQMRNQNTGHIDTLRKLAAGRDLLSPGARPSEIRGMRTMLDTLVRWAVVETVATEDPATGRRTYRSELTDRGREFLAWLDLPERNPRP